MRRFYLFIYFKELYQNSNIFAYTVYVKIVYNFFLNKILAFIIFNLKFKEERRISFLILDINLENIVWWQQERKRYKNYQNFFWSHGFSKSEKHTIDRLENDIFISQIIYLSNLVLYKILDGHSFHL